MAGVEAAKATLETVTALHASGAVHSSELRDAEAAVRYAFNTVGRALIVTTIVLVAGFLVLSMSNFGMNSKMGLCVAIVIACALATVLLFLPPLLMKIDRRTKA